MRSTPVYFIDPNGRIRYVAMTTVVEHTSQGVAYLPAASLRAWGHGIAAIAESLVIDELREANVDNPSSDGRTPTSSSIRFVRDGRLRSEPRGNSTT